MVKMTVKVDGMMCSRCEAHVNEAVRNRFQVKKAESDHETGETVIIAAEAPDDPEEGEETRESVSDRVKKILASAQETKEAAAPQLPRVAIMYVDTAKSTYDDAVDKRMFRYLNKALPADTYELIDGAPYIEMLSKLGYADLSTVERADFVEVFAGEDIDYCIYLEVQPFVSKDKLTVFTIGKDITTAVPFKIINLKTGRYVYTGKFTEKASDSSMLGGIGNKSVALKAIESAGEKILGVIQARLPKTKAEETSK